MTAENSKITRAGIVSVTYELLEEFLHLSARNIRVVDTYKEHNTFKIPALNIIIQGKDLPDECYVKPGMEIKKLSIEFKRNKDGSIIITKFIPLNIYGGSSDKIN